MSSIFDFFRGIFGKSSTQEPQPHRLRDDPRYGNNFRNPIWQTDDQDEDDINDFRGQSRYQFRIFSDPFEMTRFFETQMDDLMKSFFGGFGLGNFGDRQFAIGPFEGSDNMLPPTVDDSKHKAGPRDEVLKPQFVNPESHGFDNFSIQLPGENADPKRLREDLLKPSYQLPDGNQQDTDIDGKVNSDELAKVWKSPNNSVQPFSPSRKSFFSAFSSSTQMIRRPDGSVEQRKTVRDNEGNEEISVTRQIGNKLHTITTRKANDGSETQSEDIVNMDENELKSFDEKWQTLQSPLRESSQDDVPWYSFFGPYPKL
ncbi:HCLS1-associated protein X-1-like [Trichogramma pretiosum]|uniref:HCLS1-associated protein X-1-like n=1 Tax=Trichogramma pretiosum TaxID=7493 RepID=UPI0006C95B6D|nr:HCLS1-associated protein X-1-like [Trichogramma pretiosum]